MPGKERNFLGGTRAFTVRGAPRQVHREADGTGRATGHPAPPGLELGPLAPHSLREVSGSPQVLPADVDLRPVSRWLAAVVLAGTSGLFLLWVLGGPRAAGVLTTVMKANTSACLMAMAFLLARLPALLPAPLCCESLVTFKPNRRAVERMMVPEAPVSRMK